jgi:hypothetical protein
MTLEEINTMSPVTLFRAVFGKLEGQSLQQFADECKGLKTDEKFVEECREYARRNLVTA